jgi:hypothetical protein
VPLARYALAFRRPPRPFSPPLREEEQFRRSEVPSLDGFPSRAFAGLVTLPPRPDSRRVFAAPRSRPSVPPVRLGAAYDALGSRSRARPLWTVRASLSQTPPHRLLQHNNDARARPRASDPRPRTQALQLGPRKAGVNPSSVPCGAALAAPWCVRRPWVTPRAASEPPPPRCEKASALPIHLAMEAPRFDACAYAETGGVGR